MSESKPHFVTGKLAAPSLRALLEVLGADAGFQFTIDELPITVAALMTPDWIARHIQVPDSATRVILPGYCDGDLSRLQTQISVPVDCGPRDLRALPEYFGRPPVRGDYGKYDIEILAEINHAPQITLPAVLAEAARLRAAGADLIDVGCDPGDAWMQVGECVAALREAGHRVSIDSTNPTEIGWAVEAGAELVLSVNSNNRHAAIDWDCEVVAVPDDSQSLAGLDGTIEWLEKKNVKYRIDPILEPIGFGFAESLGRFIEVRRRYPDAEILMGTGNLTELTDCDSAGINVLLIGFCQELGIRSILTTQVINWARTSVLECDRARRLMFHAVHHKLLPKHLEPGLVMLRDAQLYEDSRTTLQALAREIRDHNFRLFAQSGEIHAVADQLYESDVDPFRLFARLLQSRPDSIDAAHAFYLGFEMCKASTALTLGKQYQQDESLDWGLLTRPEEHHRLRRATRKPEEESET